LQERLAKLVGGVAVVRVGAATEVEMKEKKARVEDALHATRAAVEEGIVPGGGVALIRSTAALDKLSVSDDERFGVNIVKRALEEPLRWIANNAGAEGSIVLDKVKNGKGAFGFDAAKEEYGDLMKAGIIDPTKVVRTALLNAASVAGLLLKLQGQGRITERNIEEALRDVRLALLEADVNVAVVRDFVEAVKRDALGEEVLRSLTPEQHFVKLVHRELVRALGGAPATLDLGGAPPVVVMLVGLNGSGKTTTTAKLARHLREERGRSPYLASVDVYRPAAMAQL